MLDRGGTTRISFTLSSSIGLSLASVLEFVGERAGRMHMPLCGHLAWDCRRYTRLNSQGLSFLLKAT